MLALPGNADYNVNQVKQNCLFSETVGLVKVVNMMDARSIRSVVFAGDYRAFLRRSLNHV
jgi:hypothetical protein